MDFIYINHCGLIILANKVATSSNLFVVKNYIKNTIFIDLNNIQSKLYLKMIPINLSVVKSIIKNTYIFSNIHITSRPYIIKVSFKLDMVIIWINIQDSQSSTSAKMLISHYFNIGSYIATIQDADINSDVLQYKNCQKQEHITFACHTQGLHCVKYNRPHKSEHHHHFTWYCKANFKTNPPCFKTKQGKPCPYIFKYLNYKGNHQANSNSCLFWRYCFNRKQNTKKYQEL